MCESHEMVGPWYAITRLLLLHARDYDWVVFGGIDPALWRFVHAFERELASQCALEVHVPPRRQKRQRLVVVPRRAGTKADVGLAAEGRRRNVACTAAGADRKAAAALPRHFHCLW